jgi:hypothetical protein
MRYSLVADKGTEKTISSDEKLARFILYHGHLRQDRTVKPDAFIPYPWLDLSVTRHLQLTQSELWNIGREVALQVGRSLLGRADIKLSSFERHKLRLVLAPCKKNPNHANITDWPTEKSAQKAIAQEIAVDAGQALEVPPH